MPYVWDVERPVRSYLIPIGDMSLEARESTRRNTDAILAEAAVEKEKIKADYGDLVIRDIDPLIDLTMAATDDWLDPVAGVAGTEHAMFNAALANNRCVAFFGVSYESPAYSNSRLRLSLGAAGANRGRFALESLFSRLEPVGYFSSPVLFVANDVVTGSVMPRIAYAVNTERMAMLGRTIEPLDITVGRPAF